MRELFAVCCFAGKRAINVISNGGHRYQSGGDAPHDTQLATPTTPTGCKIKLEYPAITSRNFKIYKFHEPAAYYQQRGAALHPAELACKTAWVRRSGIGYMMTCEYWSVARLQKDRIELRKAFV